MEQLNESLAPFLYNWACFSVPIPKSATRFSDRSGSLRDRRTHISKLAQKL